MVIRRYTCIVMMFQCTVTVLLSGGTALGMDTVSVDVVRSGRSIMHDGFLMEWSPGKAMAWDGDSVWLWDATATPEGFSGYLRSRRWEQCEGWRIVFSTVRGSDTVFLPVDSLWSGKEIKIDRSGRERTDGYALEWLFPWREGDSTSYLQISGICTDGTGDTLPVLLLHYRGIKKNSGTAGSLIGRGIFIGILAVLYIAIQRKIRNQSRRTESPRQSA